MIDCDGGDGGPDAFGVVAREEFDWSVTPPSVAIVLVLSALSPPGLSRSEGEPLADYVDPDALDAVVGHDCGDSTAIELTIRDYRVRIAGTELVVRGPVAGDR